MSFYLFSISKLTHTQNYSILLANNFVLVQGQRTEQMIIAGHKSQELYYLSQLVVCISIAFQAREHQFLGHPSPTKIHLMLLIFSHHLFIQCESCQLGKHTCYS